MLCTYTLRASYAGLMLPKPPCVALADAAVSLSVFLQELDKQNEGYMIRSGIVVILRNGTIKDGTVI